jgi:Transposase domain (DUF772)
MIVAKDVKEDVSASLHSFEGRSGCPLPSDLGEWFERKELVKLVLEAVEGVDCSLEDGHEAEGEMKTKFPLLVTLLTYCYATGVYESRQIEFETKRDATLRYLCGNACPDWNILRNFRRFHRGAITQSLVKLFALAWKSHFGFELRPEGKGRETFQFWVIDFPAEAAERIDRAIRCDSMALDE